MAGKNCRLPVPKFGLGGGKKTPEPRQTVGYTDRNLAGTNPNNEQFAPSESCPIPQHQKMGGMV